MLESNWRVFSASMSDIPLTSDMPLPTPEYSPSRVQMKPSFMTREVGSTACRTTTSIGVSWATISGLQIGECKAAALAGDVWAEWPAVLLHEHIAVHERDRCLVSYYGNGLGRRRSEEEFLELRIAHVLGDRRDVDDNLARVDDQA